MGTTVSRTALPNVLAAALNVSSATVARYAREGLIPFETTPRGHRRFNVDEVLAVLEEQRNKPSFSSRKPIERRRGAANLVTGPAFGVSPQTRLSEEIRATRTVPLAENPIDSSGTGDAASPLSAFDEMLSNAKRVLITVGG